ncbi:hypothetical protein H0H87_010655 [Tephrocybe sp. NHM501043]|nr:hypothetical protein H0H87_010655 [Tephrocybe sp. NHM501043]
MFNRFTTAAYLTGVYTTHSYRRGGAQYRFIFAPYGTRWSLNKVCWWGGWAEGENVDTLMKYLMDSLQSFKNGHGDALHPVMNGFNDSFMGEHTELAPATASELRELKQCVNVQMALINQGLDKKIDGLMSCITSAIADAHPTGYVDHIPSSNTSGLSGCTDTGHHQTVHVVPTAPYPPHPQNAPYLSKAKNSRLVPLQGIIIPNLKAGSDTWKNAIEQWERGEPERGLYIPLKDWPLEWYTGDMRTFTGSKRRDRQLVALAYERANRDDTAFLEAYPEAAKSIRLLLKRLRDDKQFAKPRKSKRGTPTERKAKEAETEESI